MTSVKNGVAGGWQGILEEDESKINKDAEGVNSRSIVQAQLSPQGQQPLQGPVVRWERFLPVRSLRVLLVENDDSTRYVVSALLKNCSYEVIDVANGLEAWDILEDPTNHIDLVLTEVVMPCLSGIGLLANMMSHKSCKNIPLIMMSSNDSMGIVFKCLSKGAVDFLVKPIRKNELKNLWQHVWRKCHSSSFSGSESGIRIQNPSKSIAEGSDNNTGSNGDDDYWSTGLNGKVGSDNGSGTQNSWSKRIVKVDNTQAMAQSYQDDPPDSTCPQVISSRSEALTGYGTATSECNKEEDALEKLSMGKYLEMGVLENHGILLDQPIRKEWKKDGEKSGKGLLENKAVNGISRKEASEQMGVVTDSSNTLTKSVPKEDLSKIITVKDTTVDETEEVSPLELNLNRPRDGDARPSASKRHILRHSDISAFTRYNTTTNANQAPTGNVGSSSPPENSSEAEKTRAMHNLESNSDETPYHHYGSNNNDDMGSSTNNAFPKPEVFYDKQVARSLVNAHPCSAYQLVKNSYNSSIKPPIQGKADSATAEEHTEHQQVQVQHHHHHYHHHHHHVHDRKQNQKLSDHSSLSLRSKAGSASQPSNMLVAPNEDVVNYSTNGSASGSNNRSNAENGSNGENTKNIVGTTDGTNMARDDGDLSKYGAEDLNGMGSRNVLDQSQSAQREAALNKFRLKRKDRCFEKKVRYQNRKKLAEQRPRVKGQFVRQVVNDDKIGE